MSLVLYNDVRGQMSKAGNFEPLLYDIVVQGLIYDFILNNFLTAERLQLVTKRIYI